MPTVTEIELTTGQLPGSVMVLGLGFEDRAAESARRLLSVIHPQSVVAVRYLVTGFADDILTAIRSSGVQHQEVAYNELASGNIPDLGSCPIIDITGLAKPAIFHLIRATLMRYEEIYVAYTAAEGYYPLEADLQPIIAAWNNENHHQLFVALKEILTGEKAPYRSIPLLPDESDGTRMRALFAFASPKHERLIHLVEERDFDLVEVVVSDSENPRSRISRIAAEVVVRGSDKGLIQKCDVTDLDTVLCALARSYEAHYLRDGFNFETGLTGDKLETVAAAVFSSAFHLNQAWYVAPAEFDPHRFTRGSGATRCFQITRQRQIPA